MAKQTLYSIGDVSSICHISIKTLRYYDQIGLVKPSVKNPTTGYRYYEKEQLIQIHLIKHLKELRFSLDEILAMLASRNMADMQRRIQEKLDGLRREIAALRGLHLNGQLFLNRIQQGSSILRSFDGEISPIEFSAATMELETIPAQDVFFIRRQIHSYRNEEVNIDRWGELIELVRREKAVMAGPLFVIYHHPPLEQFYVRSCDYEVAVPVVLSAPKNTRNFRHDPPYLAATTYHVGSFDNLIQPYIMAMQWIQNNGYEINGPIRDVFLVSPIDTERAEEYITKIILPVKKAEESSP